MSLLYAENYCEENIWHLAGDAAVGPGERFAVFITSPARATPLWKQRAAPREDEPVLWDYHVILLLRTMEGTEVYDLDTTLGFPTPLGEYLRATFHPERPVPAENRARFRVLAADEYRRSFGSDRRHMLLPDGTWRSPPPPWPLIQAGALTLDAALDLDRDTPGELMDLEALARRFGVELA
ncbi:MAG: hypothetical protein IT384_23550 [Deltaproteobacteria bacterium]|nr:hypothetical protein [Deltaproteobacteria bacterium]